MSDGEGNTSTVVDAAARFQVTGDGQAVETAAVPSEPEEPDYAWAVTLVQLPDGTPDLLPGLLPEGKTAAREPTADDLFWAFTRVQIQLKINKTIGQHLFTEQQMIQQAVQQEAAQRLMQQLGNPGVPDLSKLK